MNNSIKYPKKIELLAPAKNADIAINAINYGADAVYMGASRFGARALAGNSIDDMKRVADYAHKFDAKLYATVNTILYDSELKDAEKLIKELYRGGVDALIVQDMGILRLDIPPIALHSSTQCDLRTPDKAKFLSDMGFSQLVLARELSLDEIREIHNNTDANLEAFVYGALCVSYSGRCQISEALFDRSANRGECAQVCRMCYDLIDSNHNVLVKNKHLLSLKDLNQSDRLLAMMDAGISSFKIEGRLKDENYVKNSVALFRTELDKIMEASNGKYVKSSQGRIEYDFIPKLTKCFNRNFTHYFLDERKPGNGVSMASTDTPKSKGEYLGRLKYKSRNRLKINTSETINNGDGISFYNGEEFTGFRVNKVVDGIIYLLQDIYIPENAEMYRTYDKKYDDALIKSCTKRKIDVSFVLRDAKDLLILDAKDSLGNDITVTIENNNLEKAKSSQQHRQMEAMSKLGGTIFSMKDCEILTDKFIPASVLSEIRREAISELEIAQKISYKQDYRKKENVNACYITDTLCSADNVANHLSQKFYQSHGVKNIVPAIEVQDRNQRDTSNPLMHTRYCIRRELGACRLSNDKNHLPDEIYLRTGNHVMAVICDCMHCEMKLRLVK